MTEELKEKLKKAKGARVGTERESKCVAFGYTSAVYQFAEELVHTMVLTADEIDDGKYGYEKIRLGEAVNCAGLLYQIGVISRAEYFQFLDALYGYDFETDEYLGKPDMKKLVELTDKVRKTLDEF